MAATKDGTIAEFTLKAVVVGIALGIVFGAANAYIGLKAAMTISASIPAAVMTVALFKLFGMRGTILEANLSQTIGSASTSLASGTIFTIPALFMWGIVPPYLQVVALCFLGGVLGIAAMIPLRRLLIVNSHKELPYPEGTACAEVLRATTLGAPGGHWIFWGMGVGALVKLVTGFLFLIPGEAHALVPFLPKAEVALEITPALVAVGFILGYRQSGVLVAGSVVSAFALTPLIAFLGAKLGAPIYPESKLLIAEMSAGQIWSRYIRYIGAGAVAFAGIVTVVRNLPTMYGAFAAVAKGMSANKDTKVVVPHATDRDLPPAFVLGGILFVILVSGFVPGIFAGEMGLVQRLVCAAGVGLFGILFVAVAARIVGIVGVSSQPTSGITLVTLLGVASVFVAFGWSDPGAKAAVLTVGTIVAVAASKAGDISQDLKTGYLVGATPARQQFGQLIGAAFACWAVAATVLLLAKAYGFSSTALPAPQATLMKTIIDGVLAGDLPWDLVLTGVGVSGAAMLCGVSGLAFAIGVYLPLGTMLAIYVGGCARAFADRGAAAAVEKKEGDIGVLAASGIVAGEGLAGVLVAGLVATGWLEKSKPAMLGGAPGAIAALAAIALVCWFLVRAAKRN
jgi:putative OPT family oligopeptide transporter